MGALFADSHAHEVRPAYLKVTETEAGTFSVIWKQPVLSGKRLKMSPKFPDECAQSEPKAIMAAGTVSEASNLQCGLTSGTITIEGLERTLTDVFLEVNYLNGETKTGLLKPAANSLDLSKAQASSARQYLPIGIEHIFGGWDHLLFVIGLTLLVGGRRIWGVATAFTVAHSLTLVIAALGIFTLPSRPIEILIAASIVLLAIEIINKQNGKPTLSARRPYLLSFVIGLIHGCGFAGALSEIGLPKGTEILALFLFNLGVELGQFAVIAVALFVLMCAAKLGSKQFRFAERAATYFIATIAMFWVITRVTDYIA